MKKLLTSVVILLSAGLGSCAVQAHEGFRGYYHGGYYYSGNNWVAPLIIGGVAGYALSRPQPVVIQQPPVVVQQPLPTYGQPVYQYQNVWFDDCSCYKTVLVKIQ